MTNYTRRHFLQDTLLAAAAAAAGSTAFARADEPEKQNATPNEKLGIAMVGVHGQGKNHIKEYLNRKDVEILYVCDPDRNIGRQRVAEIAQRQRRKPRYVADMRKAFEDKAVDFVSIATPNHWHALAAIWAMQAGKDVYVEKPVSHNVWEGRRIVEIARQQDRICQTGTQCRTLKGTRDAVQCVHDGKIGEVKLARGVCYKPREPIGPPGNYQVPKEVNYNLYSGPAPMTPLTRPKLHYDWHWQWPYGNGDLGNQGIHEIDIARWGLGVNQLSDEVVSYGGRLGHGWDDDAGETANSQVIVHRFGDKTIVLEVRNMPTPRLMDAGVGVVFYGTDGYVVLNAYSAGVLLDNDLNVVRRFQGGQYGDHFANFIKAVRSRKHEDLNADILDGHLSSALCHTGNISMRLGKQVPLADVEYWTKSQPSGDTTVDTFERFAAYLKQNHLDPAKTTVSLGPTLAFDPTTETFKNNDAANAMLTREYRKPFVVPA
ncbi:MAG TPA: Gfo/Idh/MocA family oxidoreductase [Thermoguttaceae bacterium]|nr:Gfo/Idh/MocA family oxidoreductase [Thermoguttaceae bacterium]